MSGERLPTMAADAHGPAHGISPLWRWAQWAGVLALPLLAAALVTWPTRTLQVFWSVVIPLVPLVFLIQPIVWRNICPFATLNGWVGRRASGRSLGLGWLGGGGLTVVAFLLILPARPLLLDRSGTALAAVIVLIGLGALAAGLIYRDRAGFCHMLCPILPAERLYGMGPLVDVPTARCAECSVCTPRGCPELAGTKAFAQVLGPGRKTGRWLLSTWGLGFLGFPGVVLAFFTLPDAWSTSSPPLVYGWIWGGGGVSWAILALSVSVLGLQPRRAVALAAALAFSTYYWFAAVSFTETVGGGTGMVWILRLMMLSVAGLWWTRQPRAA